MRKKINIGHDHTMYFVSWNPDRSIKSNRDRYKDIPDIKPCGVFVEHKKPDGTTCGSCAMFNLPNIREVFGDRQPLWDVQDINLETLTISPSLLCMECGDHGFIRNGKWEVA